MKKEQLITVGAILAVALGLYFFGRTSGGVGPDLTSQIRAALKAQQVTVIAIAEPRAAESKAALAALREAIGQNEKGRVVFINEDAGNPNAKADLQTVGALKPPVYIVVGLDGREAYRSVVRVDSAVVAKAIRDGLAKPPVKIEDEEEGHHHH